MKTTTSIPTGYADKLRALGKTVSAPTSPSKAVLETVEYLRAATEKHYTCVRFTCPEFTSLCPLTGQPDNAVIVIDYIPRKLLVESKSLKLLLHSYRNFGAFHEVVVDSLGRRILNVADPVWLRIGGYFYPRGGIPIDVFYAHGKFPDNAWAPPQDIPTYRGR